MDARAREPIVSLTNPRVKAAVRLRDRRERDATGLTIIDGAREILRALDAGVRVEAAFIATDLREIGRGSLRRRADRPLAGDDRGQPGRARQGGLRRTVRRNRRSRREPARSLADLALPEDAARGRRRGGREAGQPRVRSSGRPTPLGAAAVIAASPRTDLFNPNAIRASIGTIFSMPVAEAPTELVLAWLVEHGIRPIAAIVGRADELHGR